MKISLFKHKIELVPLIFVTISMVVLIFLGNWQLCRMNEKNNFIKKIKYNIENPAKTLSQAEDDPEIYSKVLVSGNFSKNKNIYLYGRRTAHPEKDGYYLASVFYGDNKEIYMVLRGWLPHSMKNEIDSELFYPDKFDRTIEAIILPGEKKSIFVPENDTKNNIWFTLDLNMASKTLDITNQQIYFMEINSPFLPKGVKPLATANLAKIRNNHLEYAVTWYSLSGCLLIIFILYNKRLLK